jgi:hypothetical protein
VKEEVRSVLTDGKVLLQFALAIIIEVLGRNPDKYNNLLVNNISSSSIVRQDSLLSHIEEYKNIILEEANRLYDSLLHHFTNSIMDNVVGASSSNLKFPPAFSRPSNRDNTYRRIEEQGSFHDSEDDTAD